MLSKELSKESSNDQKVIEKDLSRLVLLAVTALIFFLLGLWMIFLPPVSYSQFISFERIGAFFLISFAVCGGIAFWQFQDRSSGLILNSEGITDNSSGISAGFTPWSDIIEVKEFHFKNQKFVSIKVENPDKYLSRGHFLQRFFRNHHFKMTGAPINISSNSLRISHPDLLDLLNAYKSKYSKMT